MKRNKVWNWINLNYIIVILIVLLGIDICFHISSCVIDNQNIILTFVGILATFIVVSNYSQVRVVKEELDQRAKDLEEKFNEIRIIHSDELKNIAYHEDLTDDVSFDIYMKQGFDYTKNKKLKAAIISYCRAMIYSLNNEDKENLLTCLDYIKNIENYNELLKEEEVKESVGAIQNHENYIDRKSVV